MLTSRSALFFFFFLHPPQPPSLIATIFRGREKEKERERERRFKTLGRTVNSGRRNPEKCRLSSRNSCLCPPPPFVPLAVTQEHHKPISPSKKREGEKSTAKKNDLTVLTFGVLTLMTLMILMFHHEKSTRNKGGGGGGAGEGATLKLNYLRFLILL